MIKSSTFNCNAYTIAYRPYKKWLSNVVVISSLLIEILVLYSIVSFLLHFLILCASVNHNMMRKHVQSEKKVYYNLRVTKTNCYFICCLRTSNFVFHTKDNNVLRIGVI